MKYLIILLMPLLMVNCKSMKDDDTKQGISGSVKWFEGNMMPGPGRSAPTGSIVKRTILICELTNASELEGEGPLFEDISSTIVKEIETDENGEFTVQLPAGKYSVFTKEDNGYFANSYDGENNVGVVTVEKNQITKVNIDINYKASY